MATPFLQSLREKNIDVFFDGNNLRLKSQSEKISDEIISFVKANKDHLILELTNKTKIPQPVNDTETMPGTKTSSNIYKRYTYPNGEVLELSKDSFDKIVRVFKMLNDAYD
ncbi:MAG: hypothetical protein HOO06_13750 [Bdellovibrionaceae bacterium]|jgi:hypothetical protein|nr:hypothetical protein [Pseudobdellovibrionaceae bacterium]